MAIKFSGNNDQYLCLNSRREQKSNQLDLVIEKAIDAGNTAKTPDSEQGKIGTGSWNTQQLKQAGFNLPNEYFIGVYTDWYRFNPDTIRRDFPGCDVTTLEDLQSAISCKHTNTLGQISEGSWNTKQIEEAGIKLPSKYFIGVYTDYFRFNPDTIRQDFPNKNIMSLADLKAAIDSIFQFNSDINEDNLQQKLNELKIKLKNSVLAKNQNNKNVPEDLRYQYSEDFLDSILTFLENKLLQEGNNMSPKEILAAFEEQFYAIVGKTDLHYYQEMLTPGVFKTTQKEDVFSGYLTAKTLLLYLDKFAESSDIQVNIFANIFKSVFEKLDLNPLEQEAFINIVIKKIVPKEPFEISDLEKLDQNADKCWLEELYKIVQEEAGKIQKVDRDTTTIDVNEFFKDSDNINAEYIVDNLDWLLLSNDGGTRKFAQMIHDLINKYNIDDKYDSEELVKSVIRLINNKYCNNPLQDYRYISKQEIENLNNNDIFSVLQEICDSDELYYQYMCGSDGLIDDFSQASTGDCWLLAGLKALCTSPLGQSIVQNSLTHNPDGSVTVTFNGMGGISYTITPEELMEAKQSYSYASGDNDIVIIELAIEKLHKDFINGKYQHPLCDNFDRDINTQGGAITKGRQEWVYYYFTGLTATTMKASDGNHDTMRNWLHDISNDVANGNSILSVTLDANVSAETIDGKTFNFGGDNGSAHAFAVVGMTDSTITIINPWSSGETLTFTFEEFLKLNPYMNYLKLNS